MPTKILTQGCSQPLPIDAAVFDLSVTLHDSFGTLVNGTFLESNPYTLHPTWPYGVNASEDAQPFPVTGRIKGMGHNGAEALKLCIRRGDVLGHLDLWPQPSTIRPGVRRCGARQQSIDIRMHFRAIRMLEASLQCPPRRSLRCLRIG